MLSIGLAVGGGWDGRQAGCLLPLARLNETREQISKWHPEVLKGNQGSMSPIDQSMSWGCGVRNKSKLSKLRLRAQ